MTGVAELMKCWDGLAIVESYDCTTEAWIWVAVHDDTLGPAVGGTRMAVYDSPAAGLQDAMRLAEGMTFKWAAAGGSYGGGKAVLALTRELTKPERIALLMRYGRLLESMNGMFSTGPDLGTTPTDMLELAKWSSHVHGVDSKTGRAEDTSPYTAAGVYYGLIAALTFVDGSDSLVGKKILIQGVGSVGATLARMVCEAGGEVLVHDTDEGRAADVASRVCARAVSADDLYATECDVYSPCATGAILNNRTIPQLRCRIVVGGANNQLEVPEDALLLEEHGILYAPDYLVNAGGAIALGVFEHESENRRMQGVVRIGETLTEILSSAASMDVTPVEAAHRLVQRRLEARRAEKAEANTGR